MSVLTAPASAARSRHRRGAGGRPPVPGWLDGVVVVASLAMTALGLVGLPLALVGDFRRLPVLLGSGLLLAVLLALWQRTTARRPRQPRASRGTTLVALLALALALGSAYVNVANASQHVLVDGDPGVYAVTGQLLASTGTLNVPTHAQDIFGGVESLNYAGAGFFPASSADSSADSSASEVYPQFLHLLPAVLAVGSWVDGPDGLVRTDPVLGALALLAIFAFGARLMRPAWALLATAGVAVLLPQLHFARDTFSEIPSQLLVFAGLALLWDATATARTPGRLRRGLLAGLVLGASCMARVDAFLYLVPLAAALVWLAARRARIAADSVPADSVPRVPSSAAAVRAGERAGWRFAVVVMAGALLPALVGLADGAFGSPAYLRSNQAPLIGSAVLIALIGLGGVLLARWRPRLGVLAARLRRPWPALATAVGVLVVLLGAYGWFIRPYTVVSRDILARTYPFIASMQRLEHLPVDGRRAYDEMTVPWLEWYLGPVALTLGIIGAAWLIRRMLVGRHRQAIPFLLIFVVATAAYVWEPRITPVQYWASRRFVPVSFPGLLLCAGFAASMLWSLASRQSAYVVRLVGRTGVAGLALATLAGPLALLATGTLVRSYVPLLPAVQALCHRLGPHDVVLLLGRPPATSELPQTLEAFCGVPAASAGDRTGHADLAAVEAAVRASGHHLVLMSSSPLPDLADGPLGGAPLREVTDVTVPTEALSLSHRPESVYPFRIQLFAKRP